ncbi:MAG: complex I subunit 1 family protein [Candidatus Omnitrophota bacterium]|nr:NADH-quinone oxidoreductase subunit H [Candidatus Omnitrophota bacterium]MDD5655098.1 NADH-quinone oxidoreductase subunit H [Candidatus Omnitrophota bacterium]
MTALFSYLIFPGFLFSALAGLMACWVDRKVTARIQWRVGPPWHQNFTDLLKLSFKEIVLPRGAGAAFLLSPALGLLAAVLTATIVGNAFITPGQAFVGDIIVVLYLLVIPAAALIIGASSSGNPLAAVGASREMKLVMSYELPFILSMIAVIVKCGGELRLGEIVTWQLNFGSNIVSWSGALSFIVAIICIQAKLGFVPFDASEAEQEIMGGVLIEYSGFPLAVFRLTRAILVYALPLFLISLFWAGNTGVLVVLGKYIVLLVVIILIKNTNPRLRIDQAMRFFWGPVTLLAIAALVLALLGK